MRLCCTNISSDHRLVHCRYNNGIILISDHNTLQNDNEVTMSQLDWTPNILFLKFNTSAFIQIISYLQETDLVIITYLNHVIELVAKSENNSSAQPLTQNAEWDLTK